MMRRLNRGHLHPVPGVRGYPEEMYGAGWEAFHQGNHLQSYRTAGEDSLLLGASLVMMGHDEAGVEVLEKVKGPEAAFYRAFGLWGMDLDREALDTLEECHRALTESHPLYARAQRLRTLIQRSTIRALVQAKNHPYPSMFNILDAMEATGYEVVSVGMLQDNDLPLEPEESLDSVLNRLPKGWCPDFYYCHQVEMHLMPSRLERAPIPLIGYTTDYDGRLLATHPWVKPLDAMVVAGGVDHLEVLRGFGIPRVYYFPKTVGVYPETFDQIPLGPKRIDILCSGTTNSIYQHDKCTLLFRLTQMSDRYRVRIEPMLDLPRYLSLTAQARVVFSFVRRQPVWSSRVLEALLAGAVALHQEGSGLEVFLGEGEGAVPYREDNLEAVVERVLAHWEEYREAAMRGREKVRRWFDLRRCMRRLLKLLAWIAQGVDPASRTSRGGSEVDFRYPPLVRGIKSFVSDSWKRDTIRALRQNLKTLREVCQKRPTPRYYNLVARNLLHRVLIADGDPPEKKERFLQEAVAVWRSGVERFPEDLMLRFNLARALYEKGELEASYRTLTTLLTRQACHLDPLSDILKDGFHSLMFPTRAYMDQVIQYLITREQRILDQIFRIVSSSVWCYRGQIEYRWGKYRESAESLMRCVSLHPHFGPYHFYLAWVWYERWVREGRAPVFLNRMIGSMAKAVTISPYLFSGWTSLALSLVQARRISMAQWIWTRCYRLFQACPHHEIPKQSREQFQQLIQILGEPREVCPEMAEKPS